MTGPPGHCAAQLDRDAFGRWYSRHAEGVFRVVLSRTGDRTLAEDLTADTFVRALAATQSATVAINDPGAWLNTIARNLVRDHYRSSRHRARNHHRRPARGRRARGPVTSGRSRQ